MIVGKCRKNINRSEVQDEVYFVHLCAEDPHRLVLLLLPHHLHLDLPTLPHLIWKIEAAFLAPVRPKFQFIEFCLRAVVFGEAGREVLKIPAAGEESVGCKPARANFDLLEGIHALHVHPHLHKIRLARVHYHPSPPDIATVLEIHH